MEKTIGIIGAEQQEIDLLLEIMTGMHTEKSAGFRFFCGLIHDRPAVVVRAGIGKVNAAACTQLLIDRFFAGVIINTGAAGSLNAAINIGDIVLSADVVQHDVDVRDLGYEPGMIPDTGKYFTADSRLRELAAACCRDINPDISVWEGRILTGDQFISSSDTKNRLVSTFDGLCAEMEGGAVAQVAALSRIPFLIVRSISDKADGSATMDYPQFSRMASVRSARLVEALIRRL